MTKLYLLIRRYLSVFLLFGALSGFAQGKSVSGTVTSSDDGSGIPGVNILEKGTSNGTVSDASGNYLITVGDNATLVYSFVGYASQEVPVGSQGTMNVTLQLDVTALNEVVVIGYGEVQKKDATGAISSVKAGDFNRGVITSPEMLIQGRTPGVQVTSSSGEPGAAVKINIRGTSSVRGGSNPLFVVDGVALAGDDISGGGADLGRGTSTPRNPLNFLNPADIESIDVLKDASATAIYGSRGANGVVLIKTKSGKGLSKELSFNSEFNVSNQAKYYDLLERDAFLKGVADRGGDPVAQDFGGNTDWQKEITRTALSQKYDLGYANSYKGGNYRAAFGYNNQEGIIKESGLKKITGRFNINHSLLNEKLKLGAQITGARLEDSYAPISDNAGFEGDLLGGAYMANPTWKNDPEIQPSNSNVNPLSLLKYHQDDATTKRLLINLSADYDITKELNFRVNYGRDRTESERAGAYSPKLVISNGITDNGRAFLADVNTSSDLLEAFFNYKKDIGTNSKFSALVGYSYQKFNRNGSNSLGFGFSKALTSMDGQIDDLRASVNSVRETVLDATDSYQSFGVDGDSFYRTELFPTPKLTSTSAAKPSSRVRSITQNTFEQEDELQSFFGRANYSYADKYLLTATFRADGSTKFGGDNQYGYFPSVAAAWRLSDEDFIPEAFDDLKLRVGYGITGNQEIPHNLYTSRQRYDDPTIDQGGNANTPGLNNVAFANPALKWEQTSQINAGLDFSFIQGKLSGTVDYYNKNTTDLLIQVNSAQPAPQPFQYQNLPANVINKGVEFSLNYTAIDNESSGLKFNFNITFNDNQVKNFDGVVDTGAISGQGLTGAFSQRIASGQPIFAYFLRDFAGYDSQGLATYPNGDVQQFLGKSPLPTQFFGFTVNYRYKNWDATAFLTGQSGHYVYNNTANAYFTSGSLGNARNVTTDVVGSGESNLNAPDASTRFLQKGDFMRFQNFNIGYNVKLKSQAIKSLYLSAGGQNLFVITGYDGLDPEVNTNKALNSVPSLGIDYSSYPRARTFSLGLRATF